MHPTRPLRFVLATTLAALLAAGRPAAAETPLNCRPAQLSNLNVTAKALKLAAQVDATLDPTTGGLTLVLTREPETATGATFFEATLPAEGFTADGNGFRYRADAGAPGGITDVRLSVRKGRTKIAVRGAGVGLDPAVTGPVRLVAATDGGCARTCGAVCKRAKNGALKCKRSAADPLCGLTSGCEALGTAADGTSRACLLPYPSDFFTAADASTGTGRRIAYERGALPANASGVHIDPAPYNLLDGFSAGPVISAYVPGGVDLAVSRIPPTTNLAASLAGDSPTLLIEADAPGCRRVLHFGENDVSFDVTGPVAPPDQLFMIRPAVRLRPATRYVVALRNFFDQQGAPVRPGAAFRTLRDGDKTKLVALEARRPAMEAILGKLETDCGVDREDLVLAWDFTTASDDSVQRYLLHMRDETFAQLEGSAAPAFVVESVEDDPFGDPRVCRRVQGVYSVPLWTTFNGPGSVLNLDPETNLPVQNGVADDIPFTVMIPCSLVGPEPSGGRPIVYGHGLLGDRGEVTAGNLRTLANTYGFVLGATDWQGFSEFDLGTIVGFLGDLSGFPKLSERLHQGVLNQLVLARLMKSPAGFASHPAFRAGDVPLIDTTEVYWYGISQGGIEGGVVMALSQEMTRGVLGVPAANYSTLLHRSVDFDPFFVLLKVGYPDPAARTLLLGLIQQLWDRSEPNGWYHHTLPGTLPDTPPHKVLVHMARSDAEVANLGTQIMVRTMGMPQLFPVNATFYGIPNAVAPFDGSALVESKFEYPDPPETNTPPAENDVHGRMRALPAIQAQIDRFLRPDGTIEQFCDGPCDPD